MSLSEQVNAAALRQVRAVFAPAPADYCEPFGPPPTAAEEAAERDYYATAARGLTIRCDGCGQDAALDDCIIGRDTEVLCPDCVAASVEPAGLPCWSEAWCEE